MREGLLPLVPDERDFHLGALVRLPDLSELPEEYSLETLLVKDQGDSDMCAAFSATTISEVQEMVELCPEYAFAKAKQIEGSIEAFGTTLRTICKVLTKVGTIEAKDAPFSLATKTRDFLADWENWPSNLDIKAAIHRKKTYATCKGQYDAFDNIRATLWLNRAKKQGVIMGVVWGWPISQAILDNVSPDGFGHAVPVIGFCTIEGVPYLKIQNSAGLAAGKQGIQYLSREVANYFVGQYGAYTFIDIDPEDAEYTQAIGAKLSDNWFIKLLKALKSIFI
jgi:hypothetical protein